MPRFILALLLAFALTGSTAQAANKPTVVLVHGAFAEPSSWHGVAARLTPAHRGIAYANPLRGISSDAAGLSELVRSIDGPVVLVGHSYGGALSRR